LKVQEKNIESGPEIANAEEMRNLAVRLQAELRGGDFSNIGSYLHDNWIRKKNLAHGISNAWIEEIYEKAIFAGAHGGKICGAGGGGFFLFYGDFGLAHELEKATGLQHIPFRMDMDGCQVIYG